MKFSMACRLVVMPYAVFELGGRGAFHVIFLIDALIVLGNYIKNILQIPRPPSPPVWTPTGQVNDRAKPEKHQQIRERQRERERESEKKPNRKRITSINQYCRNEIMGCRAHTR